MSEVSRTWDSLYKDTRAILDKIDPKRFQTIPISHALRGGFVRTRCRLPLNLKYTLHNGIRVGVIPSFGGVGVGAS
jgi:hypothetical protein